MTTPPPGGKAEGSLFELIERLDEIEDRGRSDLVLYAKGGAGAGRHSPARVCPRGADGTPACPLDPSLIEVVSVEQARDAVAVWSAWRGGVTPSPEERFRAVMFYSQHGSHLPLETDREGM